MSTTDEKLPLDENLTDPAFDERIMDDEQDVIDGVEDESGVIKARVKKVASAISGRRYRKRQMVRIDSLRPSLAERIRRDYPELPVNAKISFGELARYQMLYVEELLQQEHGEFSELDRQVAESIANQDTIAENTEGEYEENRTFGERLSDHLASFGGSWAFLISFAAMLAIWMAYNVVRGEGAAFDPYPFILLNLVLSTLAAIQAPVIMMSQKRQEEKDRARSFNDYRVNLKAELEIHHLHEKIDYLISRQWQRLSEIQQVQIEMLQQGGPRNKTKVPKKIGDRVRRAEVEVE
ncbi:putative membrane protein [Rhodoblastus sphagnicola]|nr:putative membrane protein [Rhodoblastus sphagnicola]